MNDTREYIIDKAFNLFLERSYESVSISDISNAIGLTKGALYHHFINKEELFKAVIDKHLYLVPIKFDFENGNLHDFNSVCLKHVEENIRKIILDESELVPINYVSLIADSFRHYQGFAEEKMNLMNDEAKRIQILLRESIKRNEIRDDINIDTVASIYVSTMVGLAGPFIEKKSIEKMIEMLKKHLDELYKLLKK